MHYIISRFVTVTCLIQLPCSSILPYKCPVFTCLLSFCLVAVSMNTPDLASSCLLYVQRRFVPRCIQNRCIQVRGNATMEKCFIFADGIFHPSAARGGVAKCFWKHPIAKDTQMPGQFETWNNMEQLG